MRLLGVCPAGGVEVMLFLNIGSSDAGVVVVLDASPLGRESIDDGKW